MTDLEKQMADALRKAYEALMLSRPGSENNEPTEEEWQAHFEARRTARDALAKFDAQAAEQAAGGGEAAHVRVLRDFLASLPADLGGTRRTELRGTVQRMLDEGWFAAPAAPSDPQPRGAEPQVWLYDFMDGATTVRNWSTTNKAEAFAPGNFNQRGYVPAEN